MNLFSGKKFLIAGSGKSGLAAGVFLEKEKAVVDYFDDKSSAHKTLSWEQLNPQMFDGLVVSPGFPPEHPVYKTFKKNNIPIMGEMELAFLLMKKKAIGITGTNGKTTVVTHVTEVLLDHHIKARALGNIGTPLIEAVSDEMADVFVIEMSSFQLETLKTAKLMAGCVLNITPDHLDRYGSMEEYALAKGRLSQAVLPEGRFYVESNTLKTWRPYFPESAMSYGFSQISEIALIGNKLMRFGQLEWVFSDTFLDKPLHDVENFLAAYSLLRDMDLKPEEIISSFQRLSKLPHRIEFVRKLKGVSFFDDSKGTNIDAVIKAVSAMQGSVLLIAGGVDKGSSYAAWIPHFEGKVKKIFAIGEAKEKIKRELESAILVELFSSLQEAVETAFKIAHSGDNILLSPGCSSFDMFRDYKERGEEFKKIVSTL